MQKEQMIEHHLRGRGISDERVLRAMAEVPREEFGPPALRARAYEDHPLSIGCDQTISQPYIVALMTELLGLRGAERILEVGGGSGYQTAILSRLAAEVYSVERISELALRARKTLDRLDCRNVFLRVGDGFLGWEEHAPYDGILVTCAPEDVPQPLIRQLKDGGRLVLPVGSPGLIQTLWEIRKVGNKLERRNHGGVAFVPLIRSAIPPR
ncbi:MAG: protein-L-isoaspartate(D-aspartate) O-methyltransferase [bacterium]